ncbi:MAG: hypothetical protein IH589_20185 [Anaerolineales bacterium]|nr:hypothetical protein [Anaerolineales bacterium]
MQTVPGIHARLTQVGQNAGRHPDGKAKTSQTAAFEQACYFHNVNRTRKPIRREKDERGAQM